jgi:hypothetical protein
MAIVKAGSALTTKMLQPGGVYQTDGYGLLTGRVTYLVDKANGGTAVAGGQVHPNYAALFVHKFSLTKGALELDTIDAEYVGIDPEVQPNVTLPNVTASTGLTSEHITTHPNFFGPVAPFTTAIAGNGTTFVASAINDKYKVGGEFGAHFNGTSTNAGGFVGFLDSSTGPKQAFYGKNQYLAPTTSFSGSIYTDRIGDVAKMRDAVGKTSNTNQFSGLKLIPDHVGMIWTKTVKTVEMDTLLLSQVSFEDYCVLKTGVPKIFKINYEIRFNAEGYPKQVYTRATSGA